ncbi:MAG: hypothetical protein PHH47_06385 [Gallionella sp.]|nr:hypothetical protein [Gallionella sp.]MDD4946826.1 hypothetical protein [Gallionella sp.]
MLKQIAKAVTISSGNTCNVKSRKSLKGEKDFLGLWRALTDGAKFRLQVTEKPGGCFVSCSVLLLVILVYWCATAFSVLSWAKKMIRI